MSKKFYLYWMPGQPKLTHEPKNVECLSEDDGTWEITSCPAFGWESNVYRWPVTREEYIAYHQRLIDEAAPKYREPTDEDAMERKMVEVSNDGNHARMEVEQ